MKCRLLYALIAILTVLSLTGCSGAGGGQAPGSPEKNAPSESQTSPANHQAAGLPSISLNASWPKDSLPAELAEYTGGEVTASSEESGTIHIRIADTGETELRDYLNSLRDAGWLVVSDGTQAEAVLGRYTVTFDLQGGGTALQIDVYASEAGVWPTGEIPPDVIPPLTGALVDKIEILEQTQGIWYFNYIYDGIDAAAAGEYMSMLLDSGWSGDEYVVTKTFEWNGKTYGASIEVYETLETRTTFTCNYWLKG